LNAALPTGQQISFYFDNATKLLSIQGQQRVGIQGDPDDWIRIAARAGATAEEIAEAGRDPASHIRTVLDANGTQR